MGSSEQLHRWAGQSKETDRQRKCISQAGSSDAVRPLPWEIREMAVTRLQERTIKKGGGEEGQEETGRKSKKRQQDKRRDRVTLQKN